MKIGLKVKEPKGFTIVLFSSIINIMANEVYYYIVYVLCISLIILFLSTISK